MPTSANSERLTRQQAAEQLADVAYALMTGGELRLNDELRLRIPITEEVVLKRSSTTGGGRVELALELSWDEAAAV